MKKSFVILLTFFLIIIIGVSYYVYNTRRAASLAQIFNQKYEEFTNKEILGTTLISIINKAIDDNEKNNVPLEENSIYYVDNEKNSIQITVKFLELEEPTCMENIAKQKTESFVKFFANSYFKCTNIEYHEQTKQIKSLFFEEIKV